MMEIANLSAKSNLAVTIPSTREAAEQKPNAFGIGAANQVNVELSPQARILQQNEQVQNERQAAFDQKREAANKEQDSPASVNTDYVRVSSSVGSAAANNLTNEKATEIYQSIQDLL